MGIDDKDVSLVALSLQSRFRIRCVLQIETRVYNRGELVNVNRCNIEGGAREGRHNNERQRVVGHAIARIRDGSLPRSAKEVKEKGYGAKEKTKTKLRRQLGKVLHRCVGREDGGGDKQYTARRS